MKIAITAETTVDLTNELLQEFDIKTIPLFVRLGDDEFADGTINNQQIFEYVKQTKQLPKTSAPNEQNYIDFFEETLKEYDAVIHFSISSEISSSCDHAKKAASSLQNVYVMDTKALSTGIALFCIYARQLANNGLEPLEILKKCEERQPFAQVSFVLQELNYLYKGGRCNSLQLLGSNLLKIKPQIIMENGKMRSNKKFMGSGNSIYMKYVNATLEQYNNPDLNYAFITSPNCNQDIVEEIKQLLYKKGFKNVYFTTAGATITSYCGDGCLGILYFNDGNTQK